MSSQPQNQKDSAHKSSHPNALQPIPRAIWILGFMMFSLNLSFLMVYSFSGIYLKTLLGVSTTWIGLLEGTIEATSFLLKLLSGIFSDYLRRRKPLLVLGYVLSAFSRLLLGLACSFGLVFAARLMERIGNGLQSTPRDAMVADIAPPRRIGASYGLKRSLGQAGAFLGGAVGILAMWWTSNDFQQVFWLASIPAFIALSILIFMVKEPKRYDHPAVSAEIPLPVPKSRPKMRWSNLRLLGQSFWLLMVVNAIFMLSRMSETFLILHAHGNFGLKVTYAPLVMMVFNAAWCGVSYPVGVLADRMNRYWFLAIGIIFIVLADIVLASALSLPVFFIGVALWGVQYGITQNIFLSLIVESVPENLRGTGLGCYYIILATSAFFADLGAGAISEHYGEAYAFTTSGVIALCSLLTLMVIMGYKKKK
ncbi:MAG: MFS transporter [Alphaproteobacteria bacterium]|nr:MFS transporter [Alphaproteobacteria bacterium]